jgi:acyl transferase domain-containing protein
MLNVTSVFLLHLGPSRYVLECVHMALEDGGIKRKDIHGSKTGVYIGTYVHMKY